MTALATEAITETAPFLVGDTVEILQPVPGEVWLPAVVERIDYAASARFGMCWVLTLRTDSPHTQVLTVNHNGQCWARPGLNIIRGHVED